MEIRKVNGKLMMICTDCNVEVKDKVIDTNYCNIEIMDMIMIITTVEHKCPKCGKIEIDSY